MKRKKAGRKTRKTPPAVTAKPLRDLGGEVLRNLPERWVPAQGAYKPRTEIDGVPIPPDLEQALGYYSRECVSELVVQLRDGLVACWGANEDDSEEVYGPLALDEGHVEEISRAVKDGMRRAFFLALLRYADDLKQVPEATALLEAKRRGSQKGAAARRAQAAPNRKAICKRFREMRKTTPKKTVRFLRIAEEFGMSDRHVQRIVNEAGID